MIQENLYLQEGINFLMTVSVKKTYFAEQFQLRAQQTLGLPALSIYRNPYYLHLLGEYSEFDVSNDEFVKLLSVDTGEEITLTLGNLANHPKTKRAYTLPNANFQTLVNKYPKHIDLIRGIIYPIERKGLSEDSLELVIEQAEVSAENHGLMFGTQTYQDFVDAFVSVKQLESAIDVLHAAPNFTILGYDEELLEERERASIIKAVKDKTLEFSRRWYIPNYEFDSYYPLVAWDALINVMYGAIITQRELNLRTPFVHSFHIWQYLKSKGLSDYRSILDSAQQLFLYRNFQYLLDNRGKDSNLSILTTELLNQYNVTLKQKSIVHTTEDTRDQAHPTARVITGDVRGTVSPGQYSQDGSQSLEEIFYDELDSGLEPEDLESIIELEQEKFDHSRSTLLPTKLVEMNRSISRVDTNEIYLKFLFNTIMYKQAKGRINYTVQFRPLDTEIDLILNASEVIALLVYATHREYNRKFVAKATEAFAGDDRAVDNLVGKFIIYNADRIEVTALNKASFIGKTIEIDTLTIIPDKFYTNYTYREELLDTEKWFKYHGHNRLTKAHIDVDGKRDRILQGPIAFNEADALFNYVETQVDSLFEDLGNVSNSTNAQEHMAHDVLYDSLFTHEDIELNLTNYNTYQEWRDNNSKLDDILHYLDNQKSPEDAYGEFTIELMEHLFPLAESKYAHFPALSTADFELMKQLFIRLCSYNIAFLSSSDKGNLHLKLTPVVLNDGSGLRYDADLTIRLKQYVLSQSMDLKSTLQIEAGVGTKMFNWAYRGTTVIPTFSPTVKQGYSNKVRIKPEHDVAVKTDFTQDIHIEMPAFELKSSEDFTSRPGLKYTKYTGVQNIAGPYVGDGIEGLVTQPTLPLPSGPEPGDYTVVFDGQLLCPFDGPWYFEIEHFGEIEVYLDNMLIMAGGTLTAAMQTSNNVSITAGTYPLTIKYKKGNSELLEVSWRHADIPLERIPLDVYTYNQ